MKFTKNESGPQIKFVASRLDKNSPEGRAADNHVEANVQHLVHLREQFQ